MSGGFPIFPEIVNGSDQGTNTASGVGTAVTSGSANTMGSWVQLVASTPADTAFLLAMMSNDLQTGLCTAYDIGVGGAGSEMVIAQQLIHCGVSTIEATTHYAFPVSIPAGSRIAARCQSATASDTGTINILLYDSSYTLTGAGGVDAIGFNASATLGTLMEPGTVVNTKGSWVQLTASTARDYYGLMFGLDINNTTSTGNNPMLLDIGIGAAGLEKIIIPNLFISKMSAANVARIIVPPALPIFPISIPAGTRIAARCQSISNTLGARNWGLTGYGVYK